MTTSVFGRFMNTALLMLRTTKEIKMTHSNFFLKYPELKEHFDFNKGFFRGFSVLFRNRPVTVMLDSKSRLNCNDEYQSIVIRDGKCDTVFFYLKHVDRILSLYRLQKNEEVLKFVENTKEDMWLYNCHKYIIRNDFYLSKLEFEYIEFKENTRVSRFIDSYGDVVGISTYYRKTDKIICFCSMKNGKFIKGYLGDERDLEKVITNFCKIKILNNKQINYLREWLTKISIGV